MASIRLLLPSIGILALVVGCSRRGGGGGGGDGGDSDWIAAYSACAGDEVGELWESVLSWRVLGEAPPAEITSCIGSGGNCEEVLVCAGFDVAETCDPDTYRGTCEGSFGTDCASIGGDRQVVRRFDCGDQWGDNTVCVYYDDYFTTCAAGTCDLGAGSSSCDGEVLVLCSDGLVFREDCSLSGRTCFEMGGSANCRFNGQSCEADACDGNMVTECDTHGDVESRLDCGDLVPGATCIADGEGPRCGMPAGEEECEDRDSRCEGSIARHCIAGKWFDVDCSTFLDGSCMTSGEGVRCVVAE